MTKEEIKTAIFLFDLAMKHLWGRSSRLGDVWFASHPTTAILRKSKTAEILTTDKPRDRNPDRTFQICPKTMKNNMGCLWEPLNGTMELHHNINFPNGDGPSIHTLHWKSVIFDVVLLFPKWVPGQPTINPSFINWYASNLTDFWDNLNERLQYISQIFLFPIWGGGT